MRNFSIMDITHPRRLLAFFFIFFNHHQFSVVSAATTDNVTFDFSSFTLRNLTLLGDSYIRNGTIGLTRDLGVPSSSSGSVIYNSPIRFFYPETNYTASFSTKFSFSINNVHPSSFGDGLAFFLSPDNQTLGSPGGYLGLVNSSELTKNRFIAIEFDTGLDLHFNDPNDNHVGLDIDSLSSIDTADPSLQGIDLRSGIPITAWVDYKNDKKRLRVFMSYSNLKPADPILMVNVDLSVYLKDVMYVGFSASTEGSTELHQIESWTFQLFDLLPLRERLHPHNVSDNSVLKPPFPIPNPTKNHHKKLGLGLGIGGPAFFLVALVAYGYVSVKKWKGIKLEKKSFKAEIQTGPKEFSYKELKWATKGFHESRVIGQGAFGTVYKAVFESSSSSSSSAAVSAVKRSKHYHEGKAEFVAELSIIACLRHKNLVPLQGWCADKGELLLVYEFMPNGSLDSILYRDSCVLTWSHRYKIGIGVASILTYLHEECEQQVIHRDIKSSNILLDGNYNARLGDFGLARLMDHDDKKSPVSTLTAGTMGYLAPEYLQYGKATDKTDVYSFGVVMLEVACGKRPIEKAVNLVDWVWGLYSQGKIVEAADKRLNGEFKEEDMMKLLLLGLSCANPDSMARPTMRTVLQLLLNAAAAGGDLLCKPLLVPKFKPFLTFSSTLPFQDIAI